MPTYKRKLAGEDSLNVATFVVIVIVVVILKEKYKQRLCLEQLSPNCPVQYS